MRKKLTHLVWLGYIVVFSNLENGAGCILSSLPTIRRLLGKSSGGSLQDGIIETSSTERRVSDRRASKPIIRFPLYEGLTAVDLQTVHGEDRPEKGVGAAKHNVSSLAPRDMIVPAISSSHLHPHSLWAGSTHPS